MDKSCTYGGSYYQNVAGHDPRYSYSRYRTSSDERRRILGQRAYQRSDGKEHIGGDVNIFDGEDSIASSENKLERSGSEQVGRGPPGYIIECFKIFRDFRCLVLTISS